MKDRPQPSRCAAEKFISLIVIPEERNQTVKFAFDLKVLELN